MGDRGINSMFCIVHVFHNSAQNKEILHEIWSFGSQENHLISCHQLSDFKAKMHEIQFRLHGVLPRNPLGSLQRSPDFLTVFRGSYF